MEIMVEFAELKINKYFKLVTPTGIYKGLKLYDAFDQNNAILFAQGGKIKSIYIEEDQKVFIESSEQI